MDLIKRKEKRRETMPKIQIKRKPEKILIEGEKRKKERRN
jgi:hypothetical protein